MACPLNMDGNYAHNDYDDDDNPPPPPQWCKSLRSGLGLLTVRFLDHVAGLLRQVISSLQGSLFTALCTISNLS
jgi:hypothetical protein